MTKENSNGNVELEIMVVFVKTFDYYHDKFNFGKFFQLPCKTKRILN